MHDFIMAEDSELCDVIYDGHFVPMKTVGEGTVTVPKTRKEYNDADRKAIEKSFTAKKILVCGIELDGYNRISASKNLQKLTTNELIGNLKTYEMKRKKDLEIRDPKKEKNLILKVVHTNSSNDESNMTLLLLEVLGHCSNLRKAQTSSCESKVNVITEAKDLQALTIDELVGNLKTYEMKKKKDSRRREPKKENNVILKAENNDSSEEDNDMAYLTRRFQKMPGHFIKDFPLLKQEHFKYKPDKAAKRNPIPDKRFKRKNVSDNVVKQVLEAWGDSSSESEEENDAGDSSMRAVESEANEYDSIFALMAQSDNDEDDDNDEVTFRDVQRNMKSYSPKKLMSLTNVLIDAYHSLVDDKDALTIELGDVERTRDDLVVCVVDLKETIGNLEIEKEVLTKKVASVEHERDDLMVVAVDLKEAIEKFNKEKNDLVEKVDVLEQERYGLVVVIIDLRETIEELKAERRPRNYEKGKKLLVKHILSLKTS
ncbi:uncharacterized protein [Nicotiana sylvestris]|uniref:uncharacterized protein n=1 Tax=Nicotiana sylvestris TaxID=4096 RepID=UPI00388C8448